MQTHTTEEIRRCFATSKDFNAIFDAFESALAQRLKDIEPYRCLFWNHSLSPDEIRLFAEKLTAEFPDMAYEVFSWLASIFEATSSDNYELAFLYFQRAAKARPAEPDPYLDACDCYEPDLNIPPIASLIEFVKEGANHVIPPRVLYKRLAHLCDLAGDSAQAEMYRQMAADFDGAQGGEPYRV
ncbi:MAG: hypothetical protein ABI623_08610 [bacterium]